MIVDVGSSIVSEPVKSMPSAEFCRLSGEIVNDAGYSGLELFTSGSGQVMLIVYFWSASGAGWIVKTYR